MTEPSNNDLADMIGLVIDNCMPVRLGFNKKAQIQRLVYEICKARGAGPFDVLRKAGIEDVIVSGKGMFFDRLKNRLLDMRFNEVSSDNEPYLAPLDLPLSCEDPEPWDGKLSPDRIYIEKDVRGNEWTKRFLSFFPGSNLINIERISDVPVTDPVRAYDDRLNNVFLVKTRGQALKRCPCTKNVKGCGYYVLDLGFGCAMDCHYCYLQTYSNAPGIVLPADIDDLVEPVDDHESRVTRPVRIGTGEFTDSLYLDRYTGYAARLAEMFRGRNNMILELKTKSDDIEGLTRISPPDNLVVSWTLNTLRGAKCWERGAVTVPKRLEAAASLAARGYRIGFHFDPMVLFPGWRDEYAETVDMIFDHAELRNAVEWISLGTLRFAPGLKKVAEKRFDMPGIYYSGDLFIGGDGKLRYPERARVDSYRYMREKISGHDPDIWVYLCMENENVWDLSGFSPDGHEFKGLRNKL